MGRVVHRVEVIYSQGNIAQKLRKLYGGDNSMQSTKVQIDELHCKASH